MFKRNFFQKSGLKQVTSCNFYMLFFKILFLNVKLLLYRFLEMAMEEDMFVIFRLIQFSLIFTIWRIVQPSVNLLHDFRGIETLC